MSLGRIIDDEKPYPLKVVISGAGCTKLRHIDEKDCVYYTDVARAVRT